ncbi:MAG TPA: ABC transporter ATP-binding protein [Polyangiaceae bacterium]|nr:ABC transporter ATP-binding protein [Polyangiaceae bacterium]
MSHHLVSVSDLRFAYPDGTPALQGVTFTLHHGESVGLVGANGAGKSTLLLHLAGVLVASHGAVRVGDVPVTPRTLPQVRRCVGTVFQDPDDQLFMPTVEEDVAFGPASLGLPQDEVEARIVAALERVGALHLRRRPPHRLSGGEKRAVAISTVLPMSPDVLVMDEPSSNLDPRARRRLIEQLRLFEHTKIIATHDLDLVLDVCARTIVLSGGRVVADGPTRELLADDAVLERSGLERPLRLQGCPRCGSRPPAGTAVVPLGPAG